MPAAGPWDGTIDLMIALRNVAIVALLAAAVMLLPGGGRITEAVFEALSLGFLTVIALAAYRFLRAEELTLLGMDDSCSSWRSPAPAPCGDPDSRPCSGS
jgi:hypothetical protein